MVENKIEVKNLTKKLDGRIIFSDVNLLFEEGNIYGFVGRNGSGKTVFLKCICGFMESDEGVILQNGKQVKTDVEYLDN